MFAGHSHRYKYQKDTKARKINLQIKKNTEHCVQMKKRDTLNYLLALFLLFHIARLSSSRCLNSTHGRDFVPSKSLFPRRPSH